jgi:hypothetical protein
MTDEEGDTDGDTGPSAVTRTDRRTDFSATWVAEPGTVPRPPGDIPGFHDGLRKYALFNWIGDRSYFDVPAADDERVPTPGAVERQYGCDTTRTVTDDYTLGITGETVLTDACIRLRRDERVALRERIDDRHGFADQLYYFLRRWKETSAPVESIQNYERLVKETFGVSAPIRTGGGTDADDLETRTPTYQDINSLIDFREVSQSFLTRGGEETVRVYRGLRHTSPAAVLLQAFDDPDRDAFTMRTSPAVNATTSKQVAKDYAHGMYVTLDVPTAVVLGAVDHLRPGRNPSEGEVQLIGGDLTVPARDVSLTSFGSPNVQRSREEPWEVSSDAWFLDTTVPTLADGANDDRFSAVVETEGGYHTADYELSSVIRRIDARRGPMLDATVHPILMDIVGEAAYYGLSVGTDTGGDRLREWFDQAVQQDPLRQKDREALRRIVDAVADPDPSMPWV